MDKNDVLKVSKNMYAAIPALLDGMPMGFAVMRVLIDEEGEPFDFVYEYANSLFAYLENMSLESLKQYSWGQLFPDEEMQVLGAYANIALNGGNRVIEEVEEGGDRKLRINCYQPSYGYCALIVEEVSNDNNDVSVQETAQKPAEAVQAEEPQAPKVVAEEPKAEEPFTAVPQAAEPFAGEPQQETPLLDETELQEMQKLAQMAAPVSETEQEAPAAPLEPVSEPKQEMPAAPLEPVSEPKQEMPAAPLERVSEPKQEAPAAPLERVSEPQQEMTAAPLEPVSEPKQEAPAAPLEQVNEPAQTVSVEEVITGGVTVSDIVEENKPEGYATIADLMASAGMNREEPVQENTGEGTPIGSIVGSYGGDSEGIWTEPENTEDTVEFTEIETFEVDASENAESFESQEDTAAFVAVGEDSGFDMQPIEDAKEPASEEPPALAEPVEAVPELVADENSFMAKIKKVVESIDQFNEDSALEILAGLLNDSSLDENVAGDVKKVKAMVECSMFAEAKELAQSLAAS